MKYGLMIYEDTYRGTNIGDYIQSIAARQFFPHVNYYINRERLNETPETGFKLIMNGWFTHHPENWPPSDKIDPLFVAFHINASHAEKMLSEETLRYLKHYEPIGCRDEYTVSLLESKGIKAYFSGCLTLTLDKYRVNDTERTDKIYIVDPLFNLYSFREALTSLRFGIAYFLKGRFIQSLKRYRLLKSVISRDIIKNGEYRHHMLKPNNLSESDRFQLAENLLKEYARAKCVITSRIHCALPCLALGTPVIFINSFADTSNLSRLKGLNDLFNVVNINTKTGQVSSNDIKLEDGKITLKSILPNKSNYLKYAESLKAKCLEFIKK